MSEITVALASATGAITAVAGLGTAAFGLVDATKAFGGGVSNFGFGHIERALTPFAPALRHANSDWLVTIRANWINGVGKEDQKAAAKSLIRLGLCAANAEGLAAAGHVDGARLLAIIQKIESGGNIEPSDTDVLGRFNGAIDAAMDAGFEHGDQVYRNRSRLVAGVFAVGLAVWAGALASGSGLVHGAASSLFWISPLFWPSVLVGLVAVPIAPIAKDLASSLQAAATAVQAMKP
ncbi:MAG: hypothetical protein JWO83_1341 [Caulobacteraceae bacterium]|nr:hypothetical protein [Caulobacteraceae bacterium]